MVRTRWAAVAAWIAAAATPAGAQDAATGTGSDYPTEAVMDYGLGCVTANGGGREVLKRCACSIDVIATILPYDRYEAAETFLSMGLVPGERGVLFRTSEPAQDAIDALRRAQVEAELRCF